MRYLSVCSGIEAATVAWHPLGWTPVGFAEIEKFPSAVLAHHYPTVPNHGDMTTFQEWPDATVDVLVGGTPCQSFSVAGLRAGLADPRGSLMLTFLAIARRRAPRWIVWENVPGVLSSNDGRDFGSFLGGLAECGYRWAYRVLDAQYFGLAQRRKRVFVVGHLGDWRRAAAVLFERESLQGHPAPRREAGEVAPTLPVQRTGGGGPRGDFHYDGGLIPSTGDLSHCLNAGGMGRIDYETETLIAHGLSRQHGVTEDGTGRGVPLVTALFDERTVTSPDNRQSCDPTGAVPTLHTSPFTLAIRGRGDSSDLEVRQDGTANALLTPNGGRGGIGCGAVAFAQNTRDEVREMSIVGALSADAGMKQTSYVRSAMQVRRLTPRECERLQGFPDDYTLIPYRGKPAADGPRYKALGNSMAVPVMRWIGKRIAMVDAL